MDHQGQAAACRKGELEFKGFLLGCQGLGRTDPLRPVSEKIETRFTDKVDFPIPGKESEKFGRIIPDTLGMDAESQKAAGKPRGKLAGQFEFIRIMGHRGAQPIRPRKSFGKLRIPRFEIRQMKVGVAEHPSILGKTTFAVNPKKKRKKCTFCCEST